jgi:P4 family phage/plasmid primase-like protien
VVSLRFGDAGKPVTLDAVTLDHAGLADLAEQARGKKLSGKAASLTADGLAAWPAEAKANVWALWHAIKAGREVQFVIDGKAYARPIDAALGNLVGADGDPEVYNRSLAFAADMIGRCYRPEEGPGYVEAALNQLKALGVRGKPLEAARTQLRQMVKAAVRGAYPAADATGPAGQASALLLARLFLGRCRLPSDEDAPSNGKRSRAADNGRDGGDGGEGTAPSYGLRYYGGQFYRRRPGVWVEVAADDVKQELTGVLQAVTPEHTDTRRIADVLANVKALCRLSIDQAPPLPFYLDGGGPEAAVRPRKLLALRNGLLDLDALAKGGPAKLLPHDWRWLSTTVLPYSFDPRATCPSFLRFLREVLDADVRTGRLRREGDQRIRVLQEWFGYCLLPDGRFQRFLVLTGEGQNGKGVVARLLRLLLGPGNVASIGMEALGQRFGLAPLLGKLVNISGDLNEIDNVAEGVLKQLTGEDPVTIDRKHLSAIELVPVFKLVFLCNDLPRFRDKSSGVWRRLTAMPFTYQVPADRVDPRLTARLAAELPGILNWALAGLRRLLAQGRFTECTVCRAAAEQHRHYCDSVAQFVAERAVLAVEGLREGIRGDYKVRKDVLYEAYLDWCKKAGQHPLWKATFGRGIARLPGVREGRARVAGPDGKRPEYWRGIALAPVPNIDPASADLDDDEPAGPGEAGGHD